MSQKLEEFDKLNVMKKKLAILVSGRVRKKDEINHAIEVQDRLSRKSGSWNGSKEIKKWREKR